jgi:hypothetical protein
MAPEKSIEIVCPSCGSEALLVRTPVYDGFTRVGETLSCSGCGHEFENEDAVPFKDQPRVQVFTEADRSASVEVFDENEARLCRHCRNYIVNPFTQWCGLHKKEVEATDSCDRFEPAAEPEEPI